MLQDVAHRGSQTFGLRLGLDPGPVCVHNSGLRSRKHCRTTVNLVDGQSELGRVLFDELAGYRPLEEFLAADVHALVLRGNQHTAVAHPIAAEAVTVRPDTCCIR